MPVSLAAGTSPVLLAFPSWSFERQLQTDDFFVKNMNLLRTGAVATIVYAHVRALMGPSGGAGVIRLQDHPTAPSSTVDLNVADTAGAESDQEFDTGGFGGATLITPFVLTASSGRTLSIRVVTPRSMEGPGCLIIGVQLA